MNDGSPGGGPASGEGERPARRNGRSGRRGGRNRRGRGGGNGASKERAPDAARDVAAGASQAAEPRDPSPPRTRNGPRQPRARREVSAGGVVFRVETAGDGADRTLFLLIRDSYHNWGFPKGHLERGEQPDAAALREVTEETGLGGVALRGAIETIDWYFRFRGRLIHKICHFFLMETERSETCPQLAEGITACRWAPFDEAVRLVSYANAREVLKRAHEMLGDGAAPRPPRMVEE